MSDTPRTDQRIAWWPHGDCAPEEVVPADFARQLERELALAKGAIEYLKKKFTE